MCLHPNIDRKLSTMYEKYDNHILDEFDNCDYVDKITQVQKNDLVVMQLNIRGIGSKEGNSLT